MDEELEDIKAACVESNKVTNPWAEICKRETRPQLFVALTATFFQQWTGINTVIFYGEEESLLDTSGSLGSGRGIGPCVVLCMWHPVCLAVASLRLSLATLNAANFYDLAARVHTMTARCR